MHFIEIFIPLSGESGKSITLKYAPLSVLWSLINNASYSKFQLIRTNPIVRNTYKICLQWHILNPSIKLETFDQFSKSMIFFHVFDVSRDSVLLHFELCFVRQRLASKEIVCIEKDQAAHPLISNLWEMAMARFPVNVSVVRTHLKKDFQNLVIELSAFSRINLSQSSSLDQARDKIFKLAP